jgi:hypothetical protein
VETRNISNRPVQSMLSVRRSPSVKPKMKGPASEAQPGRQSSMSGGDINVAEQEVAIQDD